MGDLKKIVNDNLERIGKTVDGLDNIFGKTAPYKGGQKTGKALSDVIDKVVDIILKK